ncbi:hypothetical protein SAMN04487820_10970 [Actinopolyspora mzabensis]|uniref:Uncharacterized protein n=1 Tax=Actinopolyspora mzabensis TaxID=995066 RepID=A0A1G9CTC8_ACTMZ|nr:hypothetical protein SAMN04487820_10970 [Actinopolyspora mzabensis]
MGLLFEQINIYCSNNSRHIYDVTIARFHIPIRRYLDNWLSKSTPSSTCLLDCSSETFGASFLYQVNSPGWQDCDLHFHLSPVLDMLLHTVSMTHIPICSDDTVEV